MPEALFMVFLLDSKGAEVCKSCRSRRELSNEYLVAKLSFDTGEIESRKVCQMLGQTWDRARINIGRGCQ